MSANRPHQWERSSLDRRAELWPLDRRRLLSVSFRRQRPLDKAQNSSCMEVQTRSRSVTQQPQRSRQGRKRIELSCWVSGEP